MYDTIIIGAGPAGLTASIYLRRANKKVLVLEKNTYGGAIINAKEIENYPACPNISGFDFATRLYKQAKDLGVVYKNEEVLSIKNNKIKKVITKKGEYEASSIIIATGTSTRKLGFEDKFIGHGVSFCATCDGNFFKNKIVAVVGGGNTAIEDALYLADIAKKVYLIHRREEFRADKKTITLLKKKNNIKYVLNSNISNIKGKDRIESIKVVDKNNKVKEFNINGLFIAIGQIPNSEIFKDLVNLTSNNYIKGTINCHTSKDGIFVAGDVRNKKIRQLVTATSDGAIAASEVIIYLNK